MGFDYILPLRIAQGVLALAVLIPAAVFVSGDSGGSGEGGFMVFNPIFTFIALGYLVAAPLWLPSIHNEWAVLGIEAVTWILWLAGFAALAALIPTYSCDFTGDQLCPTISAGKAAAALGAFEWLAFSATLGLTIWGIVQNRRTGGGDGDVEAPGVAQPQYNMQAPYEQGQVLQQPQPQPVMYQQGPQY